MTWIQTATGRAFDLINPDPADVDFEVDIPEALARIARFTGHIRSGPYSVAQHCVIGADAIFGECGDRTLASAFLLHDAHEAYIGDIATPVGWAIATYVGDALDIAPPHVRDAIKAMKYMIDAAIHKAARIAWPLPTGVESLIKHYDLRMLVTERRHLLGPSARAWNPEHDAAEPLPLRGRIQVWPWPRAADEYRARLHAYLPDLPRLGLPPRRVS